MIKILSLNQEMLDYMVRLFHVHDLGNWVF